MKTMLHSLRLVSGLAALSALATSLLASPPPSPDYQYRGAGYSHDPADVPLMVVNPARDAAPLQVSPVKLAFTVAANGIPRDVRVVVSSGHTGVDRECIRLVRRQRFEVKRVDGVAVARAETLILIPQIQS